MGHGPWIYIWDRVINRFMAFYPGIEKVLERGADRMELVLDFE
jgi:hypothetical protein